MADGIKLDLPMDAIREICIKYKVRELSIFGSALREDFRPDSDIDLLVEFEPDAEIGFLAFAGMMEDLAEVIGRKVDLVPKKGLKELIRDSVLASSKVLYAA